MNVFFCSYMHTDTDGDSDGFGGIMEPKVAATLVKKPGSRQENNNSGK